ncbi:unnamed protein product [Oikopleura dioica]|uniref:Uncharacterized protein n=1 Tax=Oikopleura dioica TaxID=34765 RepID=E4XPV4_OIKDI|nr:unnamed protein product [Oikopleura dioica]
MSPALAKIYFLYYNQTCLTPSQKSYTQQQLTTSFVVQKLLSACLLNSTTSLSNSESGFKSFLPCLRNSQRQISSNNST